jgi:hypothetical protein
LFEWLQLALKSKTRHEFLPALCLLFASNLAVAAGTAFPPADARQVAVVFAPTIEQSDVATAITATGSLLVRAGPFDNIVIMHLADHGQYTDLYQHGTWLVLDPVAAGGCVIEFSQKY